MANINKHNVSKEEETLQLAKNLDPQQTPFQQAEFRRP